MRIPLIRERADEVYLKKSRTDELLIPKRILSLSKLQKEQSHIHSVAHIVLLVIRQYEGRSYWMVLEWLVEAYNLRPFLQLSHIPRFNHFDFQKMSANRTSSNTQKEKVSITQHGLILLHHLILYFVSE